MTVLDRSFLSALALFNLLRTTGRFAAMHRKRAELLAELANEQPRVTPDRRTEYGQELAVAATEACSTHATTQPANIFRWTICGELLALPPDKSAAIAAAREVHLRLCSPGGCAGAALEILSALTGKQVGAEIAYAGSAAAILAICAPGRRVISNRGEIMLHCLSSSVPIGGARNFRRMADWLDRSTAKVVERMAARCGREIAEVESWLADDGADKHFTPEQALSLGMVDAVTSDPMDWAPPSLSI